MDKLPQDLHVDILRRLHSPDVARCRVASKIFDDAYSHLRSIKFKWTIVKPSSINLFKKIFLNLISNMRVVESLCIGDVDEFREYDKKLGDDLNLLTHEEFIMEWLSKVSQNLKSLSITYFLDDGSFWWQQAKVLNLVSANCHKLVELKMKYARLRSVDNLNPMLMLKSLTLEFIHLNDENLNKLNTCVPNLQVLNLIGVTGIRKPKIHLLNLISCHLLPKHAFLEHLSLITPRLIKLRVEEILSTSVLYVEAPLLSRLHIDCRYVQDAFSLKKFENLKQFSIKSSDIGSILYYFTITETVEDLTVDARVGIGKNFRFTLEKLFTVFPKVTSLCIRSYAWWELNREWFIIASESSSKITQGTKGLRKLRIENYKICDPSFFLLDVACVLDQCIGLSEISLLICSDVGGDVLKSEIDKCVACWPNLKWRWRMYVE
ncbi:F-box/RNI-like superfamily protein [Artemisia annua]|uniref:F-box/RNI-like superfamily protein n=1 Tax=Artemisia annua TaxID=35608 RepID=A0A2U1P667_ARTAN|nr:F-box/RNI-like superfamily protein [Artemisia annua]